MNFETALEIVLALEGGYVNDPDDRGGSTNMGITQDTYNYFRLEEDLPIRDVRHVELWEVRKIYKTRYWDKIKGDQLPPELAFVVFDAAVNHGVSRASKMLQVSVGTDTDGIVGPKTLLAVARENPVIVVSKVIRERLNLYTTLCKIEPNQKKFLVGWLSRLLHVWRKSDSRA